MNLVIIKLKKNILLLAVLIGMFFPNLGFCQSVIKGSIYFYDNKESAIACAISIVDTATMDSIVTKKKNNDFQILSDFYGNFEITTLQRNSVDLFINYIGYYNTIIKNIPVDKDIILLNAIPLFINDVVLVETRLEIERNFFGIKKKKITQHTDGKVGLFSLKNQILIECTGKSENKITCKKTRFGIEIDYNELKTCGDMR